MTSLCFFAVAVVVDIVIVFTIFPYVVAAAADVLLLLLY